MFAGFLLAITACETTQAQTKKDQSEADVLFEQGQAASEAGNYDKAFKLFSKSAERGNVSAQSAVGGMYLLGIGVKTDYQKANEWLTKASRAGNAEAQNNLG
ncbi:MAG: hypothetical protein P1P64_06675, partial [Treponemataceae bacterium]